MTLNSQLLPDLQGKLRQTVIDLMYRYYLWHFKFNRPPLKLFVLSHMRSGSSLLTHILNTNPEILGFGETFTKYSSADDSLKLMAQIHFNLRQPLVSEKYLLDKLLHNHLLLDLDLLNSENFYYIFLIREPKSTLASILKMFADWDEQRALNYYIERLNVLEKYAKYTRDRQRHLFLTYQQICQQSELVLPRLQDFLEVRHPFSEQYEVLRTTGRKFVGDTSSNIKAGKILKDKPTAQAELSPDILEAGKDAFDRCYATLAQHCLAIDG